MKRQREDEDNTVNNKRRKNLASDIFDDESLNNCFCNVPGLNSAIGHFTGSVPMRWLLGGKKFMFQFASKCCVTLNRTHKVDVTFEGDWVELMHTRWGVMSIMENIQLSLDGVTSVRPQTSKQSAKLVYTDGVMYRRIREESSTEAEEICFINTWKLKDEQEKQNDLDWFATPTLPLNGPLSEFVRTASTAGLKAAPSQEESHMPEKQVEASKENLSVNEHATKPQEVVSTATSKTPQPAPISKTPPQPAPISKTNAVVTTQQATIENQPQPALPALSHKQEKKAKKRAKAQRALAQLAATSAAADTRTTTALPQIQQSNPPTRSSANPQSVKLGELLPIEDNPNGWMVALRRFKSDYTMLKDATTEKKRFSMIGVVRGFKLPHSTPTKDWASTVCLQDPSLLSDEDFYAKRDYTITFFQRKFKEWLPQVNIGDILVLHEIKVQVYNGRPSGVGHHDRAKWAVYSIKDGCFVPPKLDQVPREQELVDGGVKFSPFLHTSEPEERYCQQLSAWWKEKSKALAESTGPVYSLSESAIPRRTQRQRLLLCDAGPDVEPNGYFDCTFEVINCYQNEDSVPAVYVTDYTKNTQVKPCQAKWCPTGLNDYVVKFDLWDAAASFSKSLVSGTYWSVRNARFKCDHNGYVEGKIVEKKFSKLERDSEYVPLQELLQRKKEWEAGIKPEQNCFEHKLIKDVRDREYVDCTVELLHTSKSYDEAYLEVTDYTAHSKLSSYRYEKEWSRGLEGLIVSIRLRDAQMQHAETLRSGAFLKIKNLRLTDNHIQKRFQGYLGGDDILIHRLDFHHPNDDLKALLERKKAREKMKDAEEQPRTKDNASDLAKKPNSTVKELKSCPKKIVKARVIARVIAYHPNPSKWIRAWCSKCKQRIPDDKRACHGCQDLDHEFVCWKFRLLLRIEDRNGDAMDVVLGDQSDFLQGLEMGDDLQHPTILSGFTKRLEPLLGDIKTSNGENTVNGLNNDYVGLIIARHESTGTEPIYMLLDAEI